MTLTFFKKTLFIGLFSPLLASEKRPADVLLEVACTLLGETSSAKAEVYQKKQPRICSCTNSKCTNFPCRSLQHLLPNFSTTKHQDFVTALHTVLLQEPSLDKINLYLKTTTTIQLKYTPFYEIPLVSDTPSAQVKTVDKYTCGICGLSIHKNQMITHLLSRHGNIKLVCPIKGCNYTCLQKNTFTHHLKHPKAECDHKVDSAAHEELFQLYQAAEARKKAKKKATDIKINGSLLLLFARPDDTKK